MAVALIAPFFVPKFPDATKWLTPAQRAHLYKKLEIDRGDYRTESMTFRSFLETCKEPTLWPMGSIYGFNVGTANAIGFFTPTIITVSTVSLPQNISSWLTSVKGLGYSGLDASLRSGYPFFASLGTLAISAWISDRYQRRGIVAIVATIVMIIGFASK